MSLPQNIVSIPLHIMILPLGIMSIPTDKYTDILALRTVSLPLLLTACLKYCELASKYREHSIKYCKLTLEHI